MRYSIATLPLGASHRVLTARSVSRRCRLLSLIGGCLAVVCPQVVTANISFFVALDGDDQWSGRVSVPNSEKSDGPFATLQRARDAVRELRTKGPVEVPITVYLRGGTHELSRTLVLTSQDSGTYLSPVTYAAFPGDRPIVSGGTAVLNWRKQADGLLAARLPWASGEGCCPNQLFINGARRIPAKDPNEGYFRMAGVVEPAAAGGVSGLGPKDAFVFRKGDIGARWALKGARIIVFFNWYTTHHGIREVDAIRNVVRVEPASLRPFGKKAEPHSRYIVENLPELLDAPGEWYFDRAQGKLTYVPIPGEALGNISGVVPRLRELIRIEGLPDKGQFVEYIHFRGISFRYSDWELPEQSAADAQNHWSLKSQAIFARGLRHASFEDCEIAHVGAYALWLERGCQDVRVRSCHLYDLGAGGIRVGENKAPKERMPLTMRIDINNNYIHDSGNVFRAGVGVWVTHSPYNRITRNEIADLPYTGISVGWRWDGRRSYSHDNLVEGNYIHNVGKGILSDLAGIYTLGVSPGTVVRGNVIHDVESYSYGGWCLYGDAYSGDIVYEKNLCFRTTSGGFFQNYASNSKVRNNIFAFSDKKPQISKGRRDEEGVRLVFERNIVFGTDAILVGPRVNAHNSRFARNLYFVTSGLDPLLGGVKYRDWQLSGQDAESLVADPLFVDPGNGDFRLREESPAFGLGISVIDLDSVGLYGDLTWTDRPRRLRRLGGFEALK